MHCVLVESFYHVGACGCSRLCSAVIARPTPLMHRTQHSADMQDVQEGSSLHARQGCAHLLQ